MTPDTIKIYSKDIIHFEMNNGVKDENFWNSTKCMYEYIFMFPPHTIDPAYEIAKDKIGSKDFLVTLIYVLLEKNRETILQELFTYFYNLETLDEVKVEITR